MPHTDDDEPGPPPEPINAETLPVLVTLLGPSGLLRLGMCSLECNAATNAPALWKSRLEADYGDVYGVRQALLVGGYKAAVKAAVRRAGWAAPGAAVVATHRHRNESEAAMEAQLDELRALEPSLKSTEGWTALEDLVKWENGKARRQTFRAHSARRGFRQKRLTVYTAGASEGAFSDWL